MFAMTVPLKEKTMNNLSTIVTDRVLSCIAENSVDKNKYVSAKTHYEILMERKRYNLFQLKLGIGRKNQIRVHLNSLEHLIARDSIYNAKTNPFERFCLYATALEFFHTVIKEKMYFEIQEP